MEGSHLADTHGFTLPMTDAASAQRSVPTGKSIYGPNDLRNDSAVNIIEKINKTHTEAPNQPAAISAAKNALGLSNKPYKHAPPVKKGKAPSKEGPWSQGREARPLPHDSLAGVPRPQTGEKYTLIDKRLLEHERQTSEPVREKAIELLRDQERERQLKGSKEDSGKNQSGTSLSRGTIDPVQVLPAFDEAGWMVAPTPQPQPVALESPEIGVPVKTTDEQPVSEETAKKAEQLDAATRNATERQKGTSYEHGSYDAAGPSADNDTSALEFASNDAAVREARARERTSNNLASLENATHDAKSREDEYRAQADREIEGYQFATREANTNAMIGQEAAKRAPMASSSDTQQTPGTGYQGRQGPVQGADNQESEISQATARERQEYEHALQKDEYNRFKNATGIGKPAEPVAYQQGPFGQTQPVGQRDETFKETLMYKAREKRHKFFDKLFCRSKDREEAKAAKKEKKLSKKSAQPSESYDRGTNADSKGNKAGQISDSLGSRENGSSTRKGVIANAQADAGHGISHQAPSPLGRTLGAQKGRPAPAQSDIPVPESQAGVGQSSLHPSAGGNYGTAPGPQQSTNEATQGAGQQRFAQNEAGRDTGSAVPQQRVRQHDWSADPADYSAPGYSGGSGAVGGQSTHQASVQQAPESSQEVTDNVPGEAQPQRSHPLINVGSQGQSFSRQAKDVI